MAVLTRPQGFGLPLWLRGLILPVVAIALLEGLALLFLGPEDYTFAAPHAIATDLIHLLTDGTMLTATYETLSCAMAGLAIGGVLGVALGVVLGLSPTLDKIAHVSVEALRPVPPAALIPLMLLVSGFGFQMETTIVAFTTLWPILVLSRSAVRHVEHGLIEVARVLEFGFLRRALVIVIPSALPRIFVAVRLATGIALTVAVAVEIVANPRGLGYGMMVANQTLHPASAFAYLVWIGVVGWGLNAGLNWLDGKYFARFR